MITYVKGELVQKQSNYVVVEAGGIGYRIFMSENAINQIGNIGEQIKIHTYHRVTEDDISLYGFLTQEELKMCELLLSVSGIGAKTAVSMLGYIEPSQFAIAIISEDVNTLKKIPGLGPKSAQRIILELKDKMKKEQQIAELTNSSAELKTNVKNVVILDTKVQEAIDALQVLGYARKDIEKAMERVNIEGLSVEDIIKKCLRELSNI